MRPRGQTRYRHHRCSGHRNGSPYDNEFVIFSAPGDYYLAGASKNLSVKNVTP
ncbi:hypothetical protein [Streptomyces chartreusis]|uniref:hypothetical protein n=1 Tax=Streptomyces chartreusis TaxID=1969 RepID=UPI00363015BE